MKRITADIAANLEAVRRRIDAACRRVDRSADDVTLVAITKTHGPEWVDAAIEAGVTDVGENRIQEFLEKRPAVARPCRWHFVGTLQRNKATKAVGQFSLIQSVDRLKLAHTLSRLGDEQGVVTRVLLEVNTSGETTKHGFDPGDVTTAGLDIARLPGLELDGLMTIGPLTDNADAIRKAFTTLSRLKGQIEDGLGRSLPHLSMGMSDDFEIAIEEGATLIRLGRVLFGQRGG